MMFCRFWCIYKILLFLGLSDWNLHLYNLLHNPELHCVIVDFSAELFPAFQGNSWNFLPIREINKIMTQLCIRFHVLAFTHVWYSRFSLASLHRFLIIKPFSRADFPNKNHPKPSSEHCRRPVNPNQASGHVSSPQALWLMPGCITWKSFQHHFLHITLRHSILGIIIRQTLAEHICLAFQ